MDEGNAAVPVDEAADAAAAMLPSWAAPGDEDPHGCVAACLSAPWTAVPIAARRPGRGRPTEADLLDEPYPGLFARLVPATAESEAVLISLPLVPQASGIDASELCLPSLPLAKLAAAAPELGILIHAPSWTRTPALVLKALDGPLDALSGLQALMIRNGVLRQLPLSAPLAHLVHLDLRNNALSVLPPALAGCGALVTIDVSSNALSDGHALADALPRHNGALTVVIASSNPLVSLDAAVILDAPTLQVLALAATELREFRTDAGNTDRILGPHLTVLDLSSNQLAADRVALGSLPWLSALYLSDNSLDPAALCDALRSDPSMLCADRLELLDLTFNHNAESVPKVEDMRGLFPALQELRTDAATVAMVASDPDEPCAACGHVGDKSQILILCDGCAEGFHPTCVGLHAPPTTSAWCCPDCETYLDPTAALDHGDNDDDDYDGAIPMV